MITNFSEKRIKIDGKEYVLFLNRKGISSWENITKASKVASELEDKYKDKFVEINDEIPDVKNDSNPFDFSKSEELDAIEKDEELLKQIYIKFYWIALYTKHQFTIAETTELFEKAEQEYGIEQLIELANKMVEDANKNRYGNTQLKKLEALN